MSVMEYINSEGTSLPSSSTGRKTMIMLTGIKAFEACWQSLKGTTASATDCRMLMQAMGQLIDNYATHDEITQELPTALKEAFDCLVDAYLNGFSLDDSRRDVLQKPETKNQLFSCAESSPAMLAAAQLRQRRKMQPTEASEAATYIVREPSELSVRAAFGSAF